MKSLKLLMMALVLYPFHLVQAQPMDVSGAAPNPPSIIRPSEGQIFTNTEDINIFVKTTIAMRCNYTLDTQHAGSLNADLEKISHTFSLGNLSDGEYTLLVSCQSNSDSSPSEMTRHFRVNGPTVHGQNIPGGPEVGAEIPPPERPANAEGAQQSGKSGCSLHTEGGSTSNSLFYISLMITLSGIFLYRKALPLKAKRKKKR